MDGAGRGLELNRGMDHALPLEEDTDVPGICRALGSRAGRYPRPLPVRRGSSPGMAVLRRAGPLVGASWLRKVCWDNPVALFGLSEAVGRG